MIFLSSEYEYFYSMLMELDGNRVEVINKFCLAKIKFCLAKRL